MPNEKRTIKVPKLEDTGRPVPIQEQLRDPRTIIDYIKNVKSDSVPKVWAFLLDKEYYFLGDQVVAFDNPQLSDESLDTCISVLAHYIGIHMAKRFVIVINHIDGTPEPTQNDRKLIKQMETLANAMRVDFYDYIIVGDKKYWSITTQNGTACYHGNQEDIT